MKSTRKESGFWGQMGSSIGDLTQLKHPMMLKKNTQKGIFEMRFCYFGVQALISYPIA